MEENLGYRIKRRDQMKTVDVIFVSDELVGSMIVSKKEYERLMRQKVKSESEKQNSQKTEEFEGKLGKRKGGHEELEVNPKKARFIDDVELALAALENEDVEKLSHNLPSTLFDQDDVSAKKICSFENNTRTFKSEITRRNNNSSSERGGGPERGKNSQTPNKKRVIKDIEEIQKILENSDDDFSGSESDDSYKVSEESSTSEDSSNETSKSEKSFFDGYCDLQNSKKKSKPTNSCLKKKLKSTKLTQEKLEELVKNFQISPAHKSSIETLFNQTLSLFNKWDFALRQNYNVLLYGAGSKREILSKFVERFLDEHPVIVVNGFFPDVSGKEILDKVCSVLNIKPEASDPLRSIEEKIKNYNVRIYLAINNIDGIMLRSNRIQCLLSQLGKMDQIHVIASVDHINAPLIWNKSTASEFNWIWYDSTTFLNYTEETVYEGNLMLQSNGKATLSSLRNVFNSLTKNSRGIFMIILKNQLESGSKKAGISFKELYQECRKELLISSDVALRSQLKEFIDHLVLKQKRNADGEEQFVIVIESSILKQFFEEQEGLGN